MAPPEKNERRSMNAFTSVRPRGADAPAKLPVQRKKKAVPITQCAGSPGVQPGVESADGAAVLRGACAAVPNCARFGSASIE